MKDINEALPRSGRHRPQPVPGRCAADQARAARRTDQPGQPEHRPQHDRQPDLPEPGQAAHGRASTSRASAATSTSSSRGPRRCSGGRLARSADSRWACAASSTTSARSGARLGESADLRAAVPGGEYSVRGYDIRIDRPARHRHAGAARHLHRPRRQQAGAVQHRVPLRASRDRSACMAYFDAGQVQDFGQKFRMDDFVMSTGAEVRFFMPVLNVPFRLIYAHNMNSGWHLRQQPAARQGRTFPVCGGVDVLGATVDAWPGLRLYLGVRSTYVKGVCQYEGVRRQSCARFGAWCARSRGRSGARATQPPATPAPATQAPASRTAAAGAAAHHAHRPAAAALSADRAGRRDRHAARVRRTAWGQGGAAAHRGAGPEEDRGAVRAAKEAAGRQAEARDAAC